MPHTIGLRHISEVSAGDIVEHEGCLRTVSARNLRRDPFIGVTLFGDSYRLGAVPVRVATFTQNNGRPSSGPQST